MHQILSLPAQLPPQAQTGAAVRSAAAGPHGSTVFAGLLSEVIGTPGLSEPQPTTLVPLSLHPAPVAERRGVPAPGLDFVVQVWPSGVSPLPLNSSTEQQAAPATQQAASVASQPLQPPPIFTAIVSAAVPSPTEGDQAQGEKVPVNIPAAPVEQSVATPLPIPELPLVGTTPAPSNLIPSEASAVATATLAAGSRGNPAFLAGEPVAEPAAELPFPRSPVPRIVVTRSEGADAVLQRFVRGAADMLLVDQKSAPGAGPLQTQPQGPAPHTFRDLVSLVVSRHAAAPQAPAKSVTAPQTPPESMAAPPTEAGTEPTEPTVVSQGGARVAMTGLTEVTADGPAPAKPDVEPEQVLRQVTRFIKVVAEGTRSEVRLQLYPEHLGKVGVHLAVGDGVVRAHLTAQDPAVRQVLEANLDQLRSRLAEQGLRVEQVQVTDGYEQSFSQSQQSSTGHRHQAHHGGHRESHGQQGWRPGQPPGAQPEEPAPPTAQPRAWSGSGQRIDHLA